MTDFSKFKVRCSSLPDLMMNGRTAADPHTYLSETAKSMLREAWIEEMYGRRKIVSTPAMKKGTIVESDVFDLIKQVTGEIFFKNNDLIENEFIKGTPDNRTIADKVPDVKSSWDIFTFAAINKDVAKKQYFWQICGYAWIEEKNKGELDFGLVNTPEELIFDEYRKLIYQGGVTESEEGEAIVRKMYTYDDIPAKDRLKRYVFDFTPEDFSLIEAKVKLARAYMDSLNL